MFIVLMRHTYVLVIIIIVRFISNLPKLSSAHCLSLIERLIRNFYNALLNANYSKLKSEPV